MTKTMKAVIFDMDGVLVDTNPHHKTAWREYYQRNGKTLSDADFVQYISGRHNTDIVAHLFGGQTLTPAEIYRLGNEKESLFRELYRPVITPVAGLLPFLKALKEAGIKLAVATSAPGRESGFCGRSPWHSECFDALLNESMVSHPKPDPEIYQKAMEMLDVDPAESVIFEDSTTGIQAAKASGALVVGMATTLTPDELWPMVDDVAIDFADMTVERLQKLVKEI